MTVVQHEGRPLADEGGSVGIIARVRPGCCHNLRPDRGCGPAGTRATTGGPGGRAVTRCDSRPCRGDIRASRVGRVDTPRPRTVHRAVIGTALAIVMGLITLHHVDASADTVPPSSEPPPVSAPPAETAAAVDTEAP